ncbi:MAG TPA: hypothetical protein DHV36_02345 [Desulfobacteraceae bacterium]|nr:hypothetical protein [Desulfobacteraceae bacterium]
MDTIWVREINERDEWDRYVFAHERSGYCHLYNWRRVIRDAYRHESVYIAAIKKDSGKICGVLPLCCFKGLFHRPSLISIPFFDTCGILGDDEAIELSLLKGCAGIVSGQGVAVELRQQAELTEPEKAMAGVLPDIYKEKVGLHLDLAGPQQAVMAGFKSKLRSQIRKGGKNGLTWKIGKRELLAPFYTVFSRNMRDLGSPVHAKRFFDAIFTHFYHHAFICIVFYRSQPVAASFMFRFKRTLSNPWASSIRAFRHLNTNMFLYWQMIRFACNTGMDTFDMGRSSKGAATYRFKKQWCPKETQLFWYRWAGTDKTRKPSGESLSIDPWKRIPVGVANLIGPMVRGHIPL